MKVIVFDVEASGAQRNHANPFDPRNKLMCIGIRFDTPYVLDRTCLNIEHQPEPYKENLDYIQNCIDNSEILVGFAMKFDIHWCKRYGIDFADIPVWDCQLYHYMKMNQAARMPSLNDVAEFYGLPVKLDVVKTEYWDKGLDTDQVPWEILEEYSNHDVDLTYKIYQEQRKEFDTLSLTRQNLINLHREDLLGLEEMEYNGSLYDADKSLAMAVELEHQIGDIDTSLSKYCANVFISFNSDRQLSSFLYGGIVKKHEQEPYIFLYKDGRTKEKTRWVEKEYNLPRIIEPLKGTDNQNGWSVDVGTLKTLKAKVKGFQAQILDLLIKRSKLEKRMSTYCLGTPKLIEKMNWEDNIVHPSYNQCVTITGRLSCVKPNLQNQDSEMNICFPSRYLV